MLAGLTFCEVLTQYPQSAFQGLSGVARGVSSSLRHKPSASICLVHRVNRGPARISLLDFRQENQKNSRRLQLSISKNTPYGRWGQGPGSVDPRFPAGSAFPVPEILEFVIAFGASEKVCPAIFPGLSRSFLGNPRTDPGNSHSLLEFSEKKAHKHKLLVPLPLGRPRGFSQGQTQFIPGTSPVCRRDKPGSPVCPRDKTQFVPGKTRVEGRQINRCVKMMCLFTR